MNTAPQTLPGFFGSDINNHDASNKLPFFPAGFSGRVKVVACKGITRRQGGRRAFIVELEIMTSNLNDVVVGTKYSWFQGLDEPGTAYPACLSFLYACLGADAQKDKDKIARLIKPRQDKWLNDAVNEDPRAGKVNALAGAEVLLTTSLKQTKPKPGYPNGTPFTLHTWAATPEQAAEFAKAV